MYLIRTIAGKRYLQLTEKLPRKIDNAVTGRYERSRYVVRVLLALLFLVVCSVIMWASSIDSISQNDAAVLKLVAATFLMAILLSTISHFRLMDTHKSVLKHLDYERTHYTPAPAYLMIANDPIYTAIMAPELESYLADPRNSLRPNEVKYLKEYLAHAEILLKKLYDDVRFANGESDKLRIQHDGDKAIQALGKEYALQLASFVGVDRTPLREYFLKREVEFEKRYLADCENLAVYSEREIVRFQQEVLKARALAANAATPAPLE